MRLPSSSYIKEITAQRYPRTFIRMAKPEQRTAASAAKAAGSLERSRTAGGGGLETRRAGVAFMPVLQWDSPREHGDQDGAQPPRTHQEW